MAWSTKPENNDDEIMAEINMTPLIDIMLVLLIIFMVTSSISLESGLDIDLPATTQTSSGDIAGEEEQAVIVSLDHQGQISVQGKGVSLEQLSQSIKEALASANTGLVIFEGDRRSSFGLAVEIMDIAKASGAARFAIAAEGE